MSGEGAVTARAGIRTAAINRVLSMARERFGMELAAVWEIGPDAERVRWFDGDASSFGIQSALPATPFGAVIRQISEGRLPTMAVDTRADSVEPAVRIAAIGSYVATPVDLGTDTQAMMIVASHFDNATLDLRDVAELDVLSRAVTKLVDQSSPAVNAVAAARIHDVIERDDLAMVFQPIIELTHGWTVGFEALARFAAEPQRGPDRWFAEAARVDQGMALELTAVRAALRRLSSLPDGTFLAINVSPATVATEQFGDLFDGVKGEQLVIELTAHASIEDPASFSRVMDRFHARGIRLAVDDAGGGFTSLSSMLQLAPDIIKLDPLLVRDIDSDPVRRALVSGLVAFAADIDATTSAEGVESLQEAVILRSLGVEHAQGHHFAPPGPLGG